METPEAPRGINYATKILARTLHVYKQFEAGGMKSTYQSKRYDLEVTPFGVKVESKETKRVILVPFANILAVELL